MAALPLGKLTILVGAGILGSVLAKEGRVSDVVSGAFKMNNLRKELEIIASSRPPVTIITMSRTGTSKYGIIMVVVAAGYGYLWWKGWKLPDMMFATRRSLSDASNSVAKQLERQMLEFRNYQHLVGFYEQIIKSTYNHPCYETTQRKLSSQLDNVECSLDESIENTARTQQEGEIAGGVWKLCDYALNMEKGINAERIQACTDYFLHNWKIDIYASPSSFSRPVLELPPASPSSLVTPPKASRPALELPSASPSRGNSGILEVVESSNRGEASNELRAPEGTNNASSSSVVAHRRERSKIASRSISEEIFHLPTLPLYRSAPALEVRLEEFELFALDRLRVVTGISDGLSRGKKPDEMQKLAIELWKTNMRHPQASEVVNKDIISHFVLQLVYCRTEDLRKWFLSMETALFRYRFMNEQPEPQRALMEEFDLPYKAVSGSELEGVGLKLDDALGFWKAEFSQKVGAERFDKEYSYGIHHNYGREGKRTDYTPYSCQKIISSTPGVGDHHGCPYRYFSEENSRAALGKMGVTGRAVGDVMDKVKNRHYQLACTFDV
ncbi:hypothetical protein DVH24_025111 [Malus domestica]|uniref:Uncharacterized protein n=1 Tax=Malus domestica TaxID=3750 RepID=A0A498HLL9_MALDO|nr:hypothetical protein DVH24_025111 [Malus domestica]